MHHFKAHVTLNPWGCRNGQRASAGGLNLVYMGILGQRPAGGIPACRTISKEMPKPMQTGV